MCDYSLAGLPSRLAVEGEQLVVQRFSTGTVGMASPHRSGAPGSSARQAPAVCIPPGARLLLRDIPENLQQQLDVVGSEEVTFAQLSATPYQYRDAVRFRTGQEILLQKLQCGQRVEVLSLAAADLEREEQEKIAEEYQRVFLG